VYRLLLTRAIFFSGDFAAEPSAAQLVAEEERIFGKSHPLVFPARQLWSNALAAVGRYDEAVAVARENVNRAQTQVDPSAERIAMNQATLARRLIQSEQYTEAEGVIRAAIGYYDQHNDKQSPLVHRTLADALMGEHRLADAQLEMRNSLDRGAHISGFVNTFFWPDLLDSQSNVLRVAGEYTAAIAPLTDACTRLNHSPGESSPQAHRCAALLAWMRAAQNPSDVALRAAFERAAQAYAALLPVQHLGRVELPLLGAQLDEMAGKATAVDVPLMRSAWKKILGIEPPAHILFLH
jgi:tetratricopeptide (TPR) repeat protein